MKKTIRGQLLTFFTLFFIIVFSMTAIGSSIKRNDHSSTPTSETIIVDNEGDGDFTSIQEAIYSASNGSLIIVYSGIYDETIDIQKHIELQGIDEEYGSGTDEGKPVINGDGSGPVVNIEADYVIISGFHIKNGTIGILVNRVIDIVISYNILSNIDSDSNKATAIDIWTIEDMNIQIIQNEIKDNDNGIYIWNIIPKFGIIQKNNLINNAFGHISYHTTIKGLLGNDRQNLISENYWDNHMIPSLPKCILGKLFLKHFDISWILFDWKATQEPYEI